MSLAGKADFRSSPTPTLLLHPDLFDLVEPPRTEVHVDEHTSRGRRDLDLRDSPSGVGEGLHHVLRVQVGVGAEDLGDGRARRDESDDGTYGHAGAAHARFATHDLDGTGHAVKRGQAHQVPAGDQAGLVRRRTCS